MWFHRHFSILPPRPAWPTWPARPVRPLALSVKNFELYPPVRHEIKMKIQWNPEWSGFQFGHQSDGIEFPRKLEMQFCVFMSPFIFICWARCINVVQLTVHLPNLKKWRKSSIIQRVRDTGLSLTSSTFEVYIFELSIVVKYFRSSIIFWEVTDIVSILGNYSIVTTLIQHYICRAVRICSTIGSPKLWFCTGISSRIISNGYVTEEAISNAILWIVSCLFYGQ